MALNNIVNNKINKQNHKHHIIRIVYVILKLRCWIIKKKLFFFSFFTFLNSFSWVFFILGQKHPKITIVFQKTAQTIKLPYYLSRFIKKNTLFYVELFSRTFDMELPFSDFWLWLLPFSSLIWERSISGETLIKSSSSSVESSRSLTTLNNIYWLVFMLIYLKCLSFITLNMLEKPEFFFIIYSNWRVKSQNKFQWLMVVYKSYFIFCEWIFELPILR